MIEGSMLRGIRGKIIRVCAVVVSPPCDACRFLEGDIEVEGKQGSGRFLPKAKFTCLQYPQAELESCVFSFSFNNLRIIP